MTRRPKEGETLRLRGGPLVTVVSAGMKYIRCACIGVGKTASFLVSIKDLLAEDVALTTPPTKPSNVGARPNMTDLDREFLGDLETKD